VVELPDVMVMAILVYFIITVDVDCSTWPIYIHVALGASRLSTEMVLDVLVGFLFIYMLMLGYEMCIAMNDALPSRPFSLGAWSFSQEKLDDTLSGDSSILFPNTTTEKVIYNSSRLPLDVVLL
jgi:hypothetical protein